ncbi:MAG: hypothetical protein MOIL_00799 [Candidatus Methanolliviera sp. GoM_oil]|jgi:hypothetical protein|nr:MAG: hypothetical protein MOIL_00799 [Candidatus Methanolliviera sp. GoM_oil]
MYKGGEIMKAVEYIANVLPDGHLSLPEEIKEKMRAGWSERTARIDNV